MAEMGINDINVWWKKAFAKTDLRQSNKKSSSSGTRWMTHNDLRDFSPVAKKGSGRNAHKR